MKNYQLYLYRRKLQHFLWPELHSMEHSYFKFIMKCLKKAEEITSVMIFQANKMSIVNLEVVVPVRGKISKKAHRLFYYNSVCKA
jgi:hypothetical protein